jgi:molybdate transport system permease protein
MRNQLAKLDSWNPLGTAATTVYVLFICLPVVALLIKAGQQSDFLRSLVSEQALLALRLSLVTSAISIGIVILVGTPFARLLARSNSAPLKIVDQLVELPIILPPVVAGVAMLLAFGRQGILGPVLSQLGVSLPFTAAAVVFAQIFVAAPFYVRSAKLGFMSVPKEYEDISQTLGISPWRTFLRITLPLAAPPLLTGIALAWARALSEFGATIMFAGNLTGKTQTMPLAIMTALETSLGTAIALSVMLLVGTLLVLLTLTLITRTRWQSVQ